MLMSIRTLLMVLLSTVALLGEFHPNVIQQIELENRLRDSNLTKEEVQDIANEQYGLYTRYTEELMRSDDMISGQKEAYDKKIYILKKILKQSKKGGDRYTIAKNELNLATHTILALHVDMLKNIFQALSLDLKKFEQKVAEEITSNQKTVDEIIKQHNYQWLLEAQGESQKLSDALQSHRDFITIIEVNNDTYGYLARDAKRLYRLERYQKYHLLGVAIYLDHTQIGREINDTLEGYNLSIIKVLLIGVVLLFFYFIRPLVLGLIRFSTRKIDLFRIYTQEIIDSVHDPVSWLLMSIGIHISLSIYYDFNIPIDHHTIINILYTVLMTFVFYRMIDSIARVRIEMIETSDTHIKSELINVAIKIGNSLIFLIGLIFVLHFVGADLTTLLSGLGLGGFALALAARETLSNFFGTLSILMSDSYSQGDWIAVDTDEGTVIEIGLRVTTIRTFDNSVVSIPNGIIANQKIRNWSRRTLGRRIKMTLSLRYDSDPETIRIAINDIRNMLRQHPNISTDKTNYQYQKSKSTKLVSLEDSLGVKRNLFVYLENFSNSSIDILVYCFTKKTDWGVWLETREDIMYRIMAILHTHSLEFAFPSLSLYSEPSSEPDTQV